MTDPNIHNSVNNLLNELKQVTQISSDLPLLEECKAALTKELYKFKPDIKPVPDNRTMSDLQKSSNRTLNPERISNK